MLGNPLAEDQIIDTPVNLPEPEALDDRPEAEAKPKWGPRQIAFILFLTVTLGGLASTVAYLAGRGGRPVAKQVEPKIIEKIVPIQVPLPVPDGKPSTEPAEASQPTPNGGFYSQVPSGGEIPVVQPEMGRWYLQVGAVEKGIAEVIARGLVLKGIPAILVPGHTAITNRVLTGPFPDNAAQNEAQRKLEALGFRPFPRRFTEPVAAASVAPPAPASTVTTPPSGARPAAPPNPPPAASSREPVSSAVPPEVAAKLKQSQ
jgi:hypothetical protein